MLETPFSYGPLYFVVRFAFYVSRKQCTLHWNINIVVLDGLSNNKSNFQYNNYKFMNNRAKNPQMGCPPARPHFAIFGSSFHDFGSFFVIVD